MLNEPIANIKGKIKISINKRGLALAVMLMFLVGMSIRTYVYFIDKGVLLTSIAIAVDAVVYLYCLNYIYKYKG